MCSFVFTNKKDFDVEQVNRFTKLRGPDHTSIQEINGFTFIHNLLSITGKFTPQPFIDGDIVCVYNGEIYNFKEFGDYDTDGHCIIPLYKEFGETFLKKLDGEFAITIIDFQKRKIIVSTDVFATKPVWVSRDGGFSCSIYESPLKSLGCNANHKLEANFCFVYDLDTFEIESTFELFKFNLNQYKDSFSDWNESFSQSIVKRAKVNVRENIFIGLSSGYDSGAISCELIKHNVPFKAYSVVGTHENKEILNQRHKLIMDSGSFAELTPYTHSNQYKHEAHKYILENVERFMFQTYSSSSHYNEYNLSIYDDNGANGLSHVASLAKRDGYKIYLSGQGADEIFSDYGFGGKKIYPHSNFGGLFPDKLDDLFPWPSFYGSSQISYLMKEEAVAGSYGLEARYPFLDPKVVQEFLWLKSELKNKWYKSVLHNYMKENNFPFDEGRKVGF